MFQYIKDVFSGSIAKENLIIFNINKISEKIESLPKEDFIRNFTFYSLAYISVTLESLLLKKPFLFSVRNGLSNKEQQEKIFEAFKIIIGVFLIFFLSNKENRNFLHKVGLFERLKTNIFSIFEYGDSDINTFDDLVDKSLQKNPIQFLFEIYRILLERVFDTRKECGAYESTLFATTFANSYKGFMGEINKKLRDQT